MTDTRPSDRDVNRAIRSWLHEDRHLDASRIAGAVLDQVEATPQRRGTWWPARRMPIMNKLVPIAIGTAAVLAVAVVAINLSPRGGSGTGGVPPSPSISPTQEPSASPSPSMSASPATSPPPLTQTFTSQMNGFSVAYPEGWIARPATEPWTDRPGVAQFADPGIDVLRDPDPDSNLFLYFSSRPIGDSTPEDWAAQQVAGFGECTPTESITVDGATGLFCDDFALVAVTTAGRGYRIALYTPTAGERHALVVAPYDRAWFEEVLATVQLRPQDALAVAPLTQTFTSQMNGFSVSYPEGWVVRAATEPWTNPPGLAQWEDPGIDVLTPPAMDNLFLYGSSRPIDVSTPGDWVAEPDADFEGCTPDEPITVDGAPGLLSVECAMVAVTTAGRGYRIALYTPTAGEGHALAVAPYDRAWFEDLLATVRLSPEDAVDVAPSSS